MELDGLGSSSESLYCWAVFYLFLAATGLCCCMRTGLVSSCDVRASHCNDFFCGPQALGAWAQ